MEMASIKPYQSKGKTLYRVQVYAGTDPLTGKKKYRSRQGIDSERKAQMVADKLEYLASHDKDITKPKLITFGQLSKEYWENYQLTVRTTTADMVKSLVKAHVTPELDHYRINLITPEIMQQVVNKWARQMPALWTRAYNYVQQVYQFGKKKGVVTRDPTMLITRPRVSKQRKSDQLLFWNKDQIAKFFSYIHPDQGLEEMEKYVMFKILFMGGLRRGEMLALLWKDVVIKNDAEADVTVDKTLVTNRRVDDPKTASSYRTVPIYDPDFVAMLKRWDKAQAKYLEGRGLTVKDHDEQRIFATAKNGAKNGSLALSTPNKWLSEIIEVHNLKPVITVHKARHSFISNLLIAGVPIPTVQRLAGHSKPDITLAVYAHINKSGKEEGAKVFSRYMLGDTIDSGTDSGGDNEN